MSTKQAVKRTANAESKKESKTVTKKVKNVPAQNNNADDENGTIHVDEQVSIVVDLSAKSRKLPDEVLQKFNNEPGRLLIAGNVAWDIIGKTGKHKELTVFHRFTDKKVSQINDRYKISFLAFWLTLFGIFSLRFFFAAQYRAIFSGASSHHSLLINEDWKVFSFGLNASGQCGHEKLHVFNAPKLIEDLRHVNIVQAAAGTKHSLFLTDEGVVYACGESKFGKLGIGPKHAKRETIAKPMQIDYNGAPIVQVGCGGDFSAILDCEGNLYTFGFPEYGQLGEQTKWTHIFFSLPHFEQLTELIRLK